MGDRPIIFSAPMVRALLDGRKTQTRRVLTLRNGIIHDRSDANDCVRFFPGDRLYVREAHALVPATAYRMSEGVEQAIDPADSDRACIYAAGWDRSSPRWRPSIHMPRWASRLTLTVTEVGVQRLQDISEDDAAAEGVHATRVMSEGYHLSSPSFVESFHGLWNSLHGPDAWDANPWVVALTFTIQHGNIDEIGGAV